jgi:integrase
MPDPNRRAVLQAAQFMAQSQTMATEPNHFKLTKGFDRYLTNEMTESDYPRDRIERVRVLKYLTDTYYPGIDAEAVSPQIFQHVLEVLSRGRPALPDDKYGSGRGRNRDYGTLCANTLNKYRSDFRHFYNWLHVQSMVSAMALYSINVLPAVQEKGRRTKAAKSSKQDRPILSEDTFWRTYREEGSLARDLWAVLFYTGARPIDIIRLRINMVDKSDPEAWVVIPKQHKTSRLNKHRVLVFGPRAQEHMAGHMDVCKYVKTAPVFRAPRGRLNKKTGHYEGWQPFTVQGLADRLKNACLEAHVEPWEMYDMRRRFANLVHGTYGPDTEARLLGHSREVAQEFYIKRDIELAKRVFKEIG